MMDQNDFLILLIMVVGSFCLGGAMGRTRSVGDRFTSRQILAGAACLIFIAVLGVFKP